MHTVARVFVSITIAIGAIAVSARLTPAAPPAEVLEPSEARYIGRLATVARPPVEQWPAIVPWQVAVPPMPSQDPRIEAPDGRSFGVDESRNRFSAADPALVRDGDVWRMFTTQVHLENVPGWESVDLVHWAPTGDVLPTLPDWAGWGKTWAPDVAQFEGGWVLYFSALYGETDLHCVGHAVSESPIGPFEPFEEPIVCELDEGGTIDPSVHVDSSGDAHLLWKVDANAIGAASILRSQRLSADGLELRGEAAELLRYEGGWEWPLIEQPEIVEEDGKVHLFYAAGWYDTAGYQVGHALCTSVRGPCERTGDDGGWITTSEGIEGPGALSLEPFEDGYVGVYHAWTNSIRSGEFRSLVVDRFVITRDGPQAREPDELSPPATR